MSGIKYKQDKSINNSFTNLIELDRGGNAEVYRANDISTNQEVAVKKLVNYTIEQRARFENEITILSSLSGHDGIMPILKTDKANYWYSMPIAIPIVKWSQDLKNRCTPRLGFIQDFTDFTPWVKELISKFIELIDVLIYLHSQNICHRDIKPENLYFYNNRIVLGDFGLVDCPENTGNITKDDKKLGAIFTMAPEMLRNPKGADGKAADVYSLAKTLWMLLTQEQKGFDGQYTFIDNSCVLRKFSHLKLISFTEIETILHKATNSDPSKRITLSEFRNLLSAWLQDVQDSIVQYGKEWDFIGQRLFPHGTPQRAVFNRIENIVNVLNILSAPNLNNHMMYPGGGGHTFTRAEMATEPGCIVIDARNDILICKPKALYYETFDDSRWNYFLLELDHLDSIPNEFISCYNHQELIEDYPGHYVNGDNFVYGIYDYDSGEPLPAEARLVSRFLGGKFMVVLGCATYNQISLTYDGRHNHMSNDELRQYILKLEELLKACVAKGFTEKEILNIPEIAAHPYPERIRENSLLSFDNSSDLPSADEFITNNYLSWSFSDIIPSDLGNGKLAFRFVFKQQPFHDILENILGKRENYVLSKDGTICNINNSHDAAVEIFEIFDREQAIDICIKLNHRIKELCQGYKILESHNYFSIEWRMVNKPTHLFTKDEIEEAMRLADDRLGNLLVIDEDGYARVIPRTSNTDGNLYPVSHETFGAYHNYVGKYSSLSTVNENYISSLECWLEYLKTGQYQYADHCEYSDCDQLIAEILNYMSN